MPNKILTIFQNLDKTMGGGWGTQKTKTVNMYDMTSDKNTVLYKTDNEEDYQRKLAELRQQKYLNNVWRTTNTNLSNTELNGMSAIKMLYRDVELMDNYPEIGAALDVYANESTCLSSKGDVVNVYSNSNRIKSIIEDLLVNRLNIQITAPMIIRALCKYGNQYMLLNVNNTRGVLGWRQMPVAEMERIENGVLNPYAMTYAAMENDDDSTSFVWMGGQSQTVQFRNWQIAHFRMLTDSAFLPYGCSVLHKARRHFRILSLMEDSMLIYRLERSIERRVYKIYVGAIDEADVQAYVQDIANNIKRTPIIDPMTGQLDLRKNILAVDQDFFIPVRTEDAATPIDTLPAAQNLTAIDDIKYIQNKVLAGLQIPKAFLNFEEPTGDGKNLALMDVRFARVINRIQQAFLMELSKVVTIHLYLLGFKDDLTNFTLTMNNPSTQAEQLEIENLSKKIDTARNAVSDPGNGIPLMSMTRAWKEIMKYNDAEIKENLEEIRLEKALAAELEKTAQIIKRTKIFDIVDKIYGEPGAEYQEDNNGGMPQDSQGGGIAGGSGGFGDGLDTLGSPGAEEAGDIGGEEGSVDTNNMTQDNTTDANQAPNGNNPVQERILKDKNKILAEQISDVFFKKAIDKIDKRIKETEYKRVPYEDKDFIINEDYNQLLDGVKKFLND